MGSTNTALIPVGGGSLIGHPGQIVDTNISLVGESGKEGGEGRLEAGDACVLRTCEDVREVGGLKRVWRANAWETFPFKHGKRFLNVHGVLSSPWGGENKQKKEKKKCLN